MVHAYAKFYRFKLVTEIRKRGSVQTQTRHNLWPHRQAQKELPELEIIQQQAGQKLHHIDDSVKATLP
jgi:hypothetical protein